MQQIVYGANLWCIYHLSFENKAIGKHYNYFSNKNFRD